MARRIVDAHHHFWDLGRNRHPWLSDEPPIAFRYGDYTALRRDYLRADYLRDAASAGLEVQGTVYVETEWDPADPRGEMRFIEAYRRETGLPTVAVAHTRLDSPEAAGAPAPRHGRAGRHGRHRVAARIRATGAAGPAL